MNLDPLAILLTVGQGTERKQRRRRKGFRSDDAKLSLPNHWRKLSWACDPFKLHQVAKNVGKLDLGIAFHINASGRVLNKKVRSGSIHGNHAANPDGASLRGFVGA